MVAMALYGAGVRRGHLPAQPDQAGGAADSYADPNLPPYRLLGYTVAGCGISYQFLRGFKPPGFLISLNLVETALTELLYAL